MARTMYTKSKSGEIDMQREIIGLSKFNKGDRKKNLQLG